MEKARLGTGGRTEEARGWDGDTDTPRHGTDLIGTLARP